MVITDRLVWLHIPKTAGDATLAMFEKVSCEVRLMHERHDPRKHETLQQAREQFPEVDELAVIVNLRRLPEVALSFFHHMQRHDPDARFANGRSFADMRFRDYLDYVLEHPDTHSYDWHFDHFLGDRDPDHWLRVDRLASSFIEVVGAYHEVAPGGLGEIRETHENVASYNRDLSRWFAPEEAAALYEMSPRWCLAERRVYGYLLCESSD